ncbi:MAG: DUF5666 domain-containing protein [Woeseiaceae bacterium]|nr:DUF5666 domain-containing protein [Woeseiaceae bacterium]
MNTIKTIRNTGVASFAAFLIACGGGGGGGDAQNDGQGAGGNNPTGGIDARGSAVAVGTISGFGSVIVNGVRFDTSNAIFTIDDEAGSESDLAVGQVVVVTGEIDDDGTTGTADAVSFDDAVEGPISEIDTANNTLIVLGQTVVVDTGTSFEDDIEPGSILGLAVGDIVEVSGFYLADGRILATYIELESPGDDFEVTGQVRNLDVGALTFEISGLVVDYSGAMLEDFPGGAPENGQIVEAEGPTLGPNGELVATSVEFESEDGSFGILDDGDDVEIEGLITRFDSATDFDVNGLSVTTNASTEFENGSAADLALNRRVEVEGSVNSNGVIVADEIEFEQEADLEFAGNVEATSADSITLLGVTIRVTPKTELDDQRADSVRTFSLADLVVGDFVEVDAYDDGNGLVAASIEREDDLDEDRVSGPVAEIAEPEFTVNGVTVRTDANTEYETDELEIDAADFFGSALGQFVEVEGSFSNGVLLASEVELDDD